MAASKRLTNKTVAAPHPFPVIPGLTRDPAFFPDAKGNKKNWDPGQARDDMICVCA